MHNLIGNLRNPGLYLLPAALLMLCGALLTALLYNPVPPIHPAAVSPAVASADEEYWRTHTEEMFMMLLVDALHQSQIAQEIQARTLMYHLPTGEMPAPSQTTPLFIDNDDNDSKRPILVRL